MATSEGAVDPPGIRGTDSAGAGGDSAGGGGVVPVGALPSSELIIWKSITGIRQGVLILSLIESE